jgi:hypothetical protein
MEFHSPDNERLARRLTTRVRCTALSLKLMADEIQKLAIAFRTFKEVCDYHEIRGFPDDPERN